MCDEITYDITDARTIFEHAKLLIDTTLRRICPKDMIYTKFKGKGSFGQLLEECYFRIAPKNSPGPDFLEAGLELKSFPLLVASSGEYRAKERLVLSVIDYIGIIDESFENSAFWSKNQRLLIIMYLWAKGVHALDQWIKGVEDMDLNSDEFREDQKVIRHDWSIIRDKVISGLAHELSEGDTLYLGACTKGTTAGTSYRNQPNSPLKAKQRAFSLKQSYMNSYVGKVMKDGASARERSNSIQSGIREDHGAFDLRSYVVGMLRPYFGYSVPDLERSLRLSYKRNAKHFFSLITKNILGLPADARITEFIKAGITVRTLKLDKNGRLREAVSFPAFSYCDIAQSSWEGSDLQRTLSSPFLFSVFKDTINGPVLQDAFFWNMPDDDMEMVQKTWEETRRRIAEGSANCLPKSSETSVIHVRPHARNSYDTFPLPDGSTLVKKSFWLNRDYIADKVLRHGLR